MTDAHVLLRAFTESWEAGLRPDVEAFLAATPAHQHSEFVNAIEAFLRDASLPRYDDKTLEELESSQAVREAARAIDGRAGTWPVLLPALRRQRRLRRTDVARRLASELGFSSAHERVHQHLHRMEYGTADALRVSGRVLEGLARVLGTTAARLERAGRVPTLGGPTTGLVPTRRGLPDAPPFSEVPSGYRLPDTHHPPEWAALDRLFLGEDGMTSAGRRAERAEALAQRELAAVPRWLWDGQSLPVPIESIAENHYGMFVEDRHSLEEYATEADAHVSGVLLRARGRILVDALEAARAPGRKRFTIAHELGHLVLEDEDVGPRVGRLESTESPTPRRVVVGHRHPAALAYPPGELEANQFAAALLMPARHLRATGIDRPNELAELCGVSVAAAEKRLEYLSWLEDEDERAPDPTRPSSLVPLT